MKTSTWLCIFCAPVLFLQPVLIASQQFREFHGDIQTNCSQTDVLYRVDLGEVADTSLTRCVATCFSADTCTGVVVLSESCHLLGEYTSLANDINTQQGTACTLVELDPGLDGGNLVDDFNVCPDGFAGQYCNIPIEQTCSAAYTSVDTQFSSAGLDVLKNIEATHLIKAYGLYFGGYVSLHRDTFHEYSENLRQFSLQSHWELSHFDIQTNTQPKSVSRAFRSDGRESNAMFDLDGTGHAVSSQYALSYSFVVRDSGEQFTAYNTSNGGDDSDLQNAITAGFEFTGAQALVYELDGNNSLQAAQHFLWQRVETDDDFEIDVPLHYKHKVKTLSGFSYELKHDLTSGEMSEEESGLDTVWMFDRCWHRASLDTNTNTRSASYVRNAILRGKRARAIADGVSGISHAAYILPSSEVLFQLRPYLEPRLGGPLCCGIATNVHTLVATNGSMVRCRHYLMNTDNLDYNISPARRVVHDVDWFVSDRKWIRVYEMKLDGHHINGSILELVSHVNDGADVHLLIRHADGWHLSLLADSVSVYLHQITAEVATVLSLHITNSTWSLSDPSTCLLNNYLITTAYGVSGYEYSLGPMSSNKSRHWNMHGSQGTVVWFVSP